MEAAIINYLDDPDVVTDDCISVFLNRAVAHGSRTLVALEHQGYKCNIASITIIHFKNILEIEVETLHANLAYDKTIVILQFLCIAVNLGIPGMMWLYKALRTFRLAKLIFCKYRGSQIDANRLDTILDLH